MSAQKYFTTALVDLGAEAPRLSGLFASPGFLQEKKLGVTEQFTSGAEAYHRTHFHPESERKRLEIGLASLRNIPSSPTILDIGSGSGNSVVALLDLFPSAHIVATDISEDLLCILQRELLQRGASHQVDIVCADLHTVELAPEKFDLMYAGSILHHLLDPTSVMSKMAVGLKPGGAAMFLEPFENCYGLLKAIWSTILAHPAAGEIGKAETELWRQLIYQWNVRMGSDKSNVPYYFDDKWLFTERYFKDACRSTGFRSVEIFGEPPPRDVLRYASKMSMDNLIGVGNWSLPDWVWPIIQTFDEMYSDELHRDTLFLSALIIAMR